MDIKKIKSKINLLEAQVKQFKESGLFEANTIEKLTAPLNSELLVLHSQYNELLASQKPEDMDVTAPEIVS